MNWAITQPTNAPSKPIVTGAFTPHGGQAMFDMLAIFAGSHQALADKPRAIFDVCPSPPLIWSEFGAQNLIDLAKAHVPAQIVSMPLAGVAAPVTLAGAVVQHAAESLSGRFLIRPEGHVDGDAQRDFLWRTGNSGFRWSCHP